MHLSIFTVLAAVLVCGSYAERIYAGARATTEDYGFDTGSRGRSPSGSRTPTFEGDQEAVRGYGSSDSWTTDSPRRYTHTWDRDQSVTRSSYLDSFTTQRRAGSNDRDRDSDVYSGYGTRRPSYQTDRWGDVVAGGVTTPRSPYGYDRTESAWGSGSSYGSGSRTTSRYGSSYGTGSDYASGTYGSGSSLASSRDIFDRNNAYVRIEAELVKLTNEKGLTSEGSKCDTFGACDTICYGYIDTERPNAEFTVPRDTKFWPKLFETDDNNSPSFSKANVTRDVCGSPYREANFKTYCEDRDSINSNDLINQWNCPITRDPEGETFATWHSGVCTPKFQAGTMTLTFRYKIHTIGRLRCDPTTGALTGGATPTTRRRS